MRLIAVDPGLTVGYAEYNEHDDDYDLTSDQKHKWPFLHHVDPHTWGDGWFDVVVLERYTITPQTLKMSRQPHPIEVIGVLRWWCELTQTELVEQSPAEAKGFVTNDRLKTMGLYRPGNDHANDGMRHAVLYLVKQGAINAKELIPSERA